MKILYISHLKGDVANGLSWSVPASVYAQSKYDDVYWMNTSNVMMKHWRDVPCFHSINNVKWNIFDNLPICFKTPDLVVFEGFYDSLLDPFWGIQLSKCHIPYVIIPRSALSIKAMNNHARIKKKLAHMLFYNQFVKNSVALHLLTNREAEETLCLFDKQYCIIPNGINLPTNVLDKSQLIGIKAVFIGRIDIYQKGIDLLLQAIKIKADKLRNSNFSLDIYGPKCQDYEKVCDIIQEYNIKDIVSLRGEIFEDNKRKVLNEANLFVLTSRFEGHPMGLVEALSFGLPCLITEGTNMTTEVENFNAGFISSVSVDGISAMLDDVVCRKHELSKMSKQALLLSKEYNWDSIAKLTHMCYNKFI